MTYVRHLARHLPPCKHQNLLISVLGSQGVESRTLYQEFKSKNGWACGPLTQDCVIKGQKVQTLEPESLLPHVIAV